MPCEVIEAGAAPASAHTFPASRIGLPKVAALSIDALAQRSRPFSAAMSSSHVSQIQIAP